MFFFSFAHFIKFTVNYTLLKIPNLNYLFHCRIQSPSNDTHKVNVGLPQAYMELDPQTRQGESTYQQPITKDQQDKDSSQAYMDLNPQTREDKATYQDLDKNAKSPQGAESQAYEEIKEAKSIAGNKIESQAYVNVKPKKPGQPRRK